ncbi:MAG TPA: hypothetical protein VHE54_03865 [Puia sp.]|nr:hypothetical protein [Puia sp.]
MKRKKFRIIVFSLLGAGLAAMIVSVNVTEERTKELLLGATGLLYLAAAVQIVIYKRNG